MSPVRSSIAGSGFAPGSRARSIPARCQPGRSRPAAGDPTCPLLGTATFRTAGDGAESLPSSNQDGRCQDRGDAGDPHWNLPVSWARALDRARAQWPRWPDVHPMTVWANGKVSGCQRCIPCTNGRSGAVSIADRCTGRPDPRSTGCSFAQMVTRCTPGAPDRWNRPRRSSRNLVPASPAATQPISPARPDPTAALNRRPWPEAATACRDRRPGYPDPRDVGCPCR